MTVLLLAVPGPETSCGLWPIVSVAPNTRTRAPRCARSPPVPCPRHGSTDDLQVKRHTNGSVKKICHRYNYPKPKKVLYEINLIMGGSVDGSQTVPWWINWGKMDQVMGKLENSQGCANEKQGRDKYHMALPTSTRGNWEEIECYINAEKMLTPMSISILFIKCKDTHHIQLTQYCVTWKRFGTINYSFYTIQIDCKDISYS